METAQWPEMTLRLPDLVPRSWPHLGQKQCCSSHTATTSQGLPVIASAETLHWVAELGYVLMAFSFDMD